MNFHVQIAQMLARGDLCGRRAAALVARRTTHLAGKHDAKSPGTVALQVSID